MDLEIQETDREGIQISVCLYSVFHCRRRILLNDQSRQLNVSTPCLQARRAHITRRFRSVFVYLPLKCVAIHHIIVTGVQVLVLDLFTRQRTAIARTLRVRCFEYSRNFLKLNLSKSSTKFTPHCLTNPATIQHHARARTYTHYLQNEQKLQFEAHVAASCREVRQCMSALAWQKKAFHLLLGPKILLRFRQSTYCKLYRTWI